jgi:diketogulonate reductase-like aldo/keto reductase
MTTMLLLHSSTNRARCYYYYCRAISSVVLLIAVGAAMAMVVDAGAAAATSDAAAVATSSSSLDRNGSSYYEVPHGNIHAAGSGALVATSQGGGSGHRRPRSRPSGTTIDDKPTTTTINDKTNGRERNNDDGVNVNNVNVNDNPIPSKFLGLDVHGRPVYVPLVGAGTWQYNDTIAYQSLCRAFSVGYTFVDTAYGYNNQRGVGAAIRDCWNIKNKSREDLFVMTKIPGGLNATQVEEAHQRNLLQLGLDYVDHLMTHYPSDWDGRTGASPESRQREWLALEGIYKRGEARSIGISHYCSKHVWDVMWVATVTPSINQVEYHVGSQDVDHVMDTCSDLGITFMSYSPLCGPCKYEPNDSLVDGDLVNEIASHYVNVTGSQVSLRYIVQQGIPVIPKSNTLSHLQSNMDIFDFELSEMHMQRLRMATRPAAQAGDCDIKWESTTATDIIITS